MPRLLARQDERSVNPARGAGLIGALHWAISPATNAAAADAQVAQLVEHATENRSVGGSIPPLGTTLNFLRKFAILDPENRSPGKPDFPIADPLRTLFRRFRPGRMRGSYAANRPPSAWLSRHPGRFGKAGGRRREAASNPATIAFCVRSSL
jgi:hypothetical protein